MLPSIILMSLSLVILIHDMLGSNKERQEAEKGMYEEAFEREGWKAFKRRYAASQRLTRSLRNS